MRRVLALAVAGLCTFGLAAVAAIPAAAAPSAATLPGGSYRALTPTVLVDTRSGLAAPKGATHEITVQAGGHGGVPTTGVSAVVVTIIATGTARPGWLVAYPSDQARPGVQSLAFTPGQTEAGTAFVTLDPTGRFTIYSNQATQLIVGVQGYFTTPDTAGSSGLFNPVTPATVYDTRRAADAPALAAHTTRAVAVTGRAGIPKSNVTAVVVNTTVTGPGAPGYLVAYATGTARPGLSDVNFIRGQTIAGRAIVPVGPNGTISVYNSAAASTHVVVSVSGYFTTGTGSYYVPAAAERIVDSRVDGVAGAAGHTALEPGLVGHAPITGQLYLKPLKAWTDEVPPFTAITTPTAVVGALTAYLPAATGWLAVQPSDVAGVRASDLNYTREQTTTNNLVSAVGSQGQLNFSVTGQTAALLDLSGYFARPAPQPTPSGVWLTGADLGVSNSDVYFPSGPEYGPVTVPQLSESLTGVTQLTAAAEPPLALRNDGTVWSWGEPTAVYGVVRQPQQVPSLANVTAIAGSDDDSYALSGGQVWAWGFNGNGELGDGTTTASTTPVLISGLTNIVAIAAGYSTAFAVSSSGQVYAWGWNGAGALDNGTERGQSDVPVLIPGLSGISSVSASTWWNYAVATNGTVYGWGSGAGEAPVAPATVAGACPTRTSTANEDYAWLLCDDGTIAILGGLEVSALPGLSGATAITPIFNNSSQVQALAADGTVWNDQASWIYSAGPVGLTGSWTPVRGLTGVTAIGSSEFSQYAAVGG